MRHLRNLLGGFLLWAVHFFAVYIIASIFPGTTTSIVLILAITLVMLAITLWSTARTFRALQGASDGLHRWTISLSLFGYGLAGIAIIYQALPAILV